MKTLTDIFDIRHGNKFDLNKMRQQDGGINFVGRSGRKQGVSAEVAPIRGVAPFEAGAITVSLGGTRLLSAFVQERPFYTAQNVDVLLPKKKMTFAEKVFACLCIRHNRFRYSAFGREANRTLSTIRVPDPTVVTERPSWFKNVSHSIVTGTAAPASPGFNQSLNDVHSRPFRLSNLFEIKRGKGIPKNDRQSGTTPYIGALDRNNGLVGYVSQPAMHPAGTLTLNWNGVGGVGVAFYQPVAYWCSGDVNALYPKFEMTVAIAQFLITSIRRERYRFGFGRKLTAERMAALEICLPALDDETPDWDFIQKFIDSLPFSSQL